MIILKWVPRFFKFWEKTREKDIRYHNAEEFRQLVFAMLPVAGPILNTASGYLERLHQSRAIDFVSQFKTILEKYYKKGKIVADDFKNEDFLEIMEAVYSNVIKTKSEHKRERFRNLLARQLVMPDEAQKGLKLVQLLNDLSDVQIILLDIIKVAYPYERGFNFRSQLEIYNESMGEEPYLYHDKIDLKIGNSKITVMDKEIEFYVNDLVVKGLINKIESIKEDRVNFPALTSTVTNRPLKNPAKPKLESKYTISYIGMVLLDRIQDFDDNPGATQASQIT
ncbi:MAG: hypothetical protein ACO1N0_12730 [Fluviicola sp.]